MSEFSISKVGNDTASKAIDIINKFKAGKQERTAAAASGNVPIGELLAKYSQHMSTNSTATGGMRFE